MRIPLLQNHLARQILGGVGGMVVASLVYVVFQQISSLGNSRAMLVDTPTISGKSGTVQVNEVSPDPTELRKVAQHAREIAAALSSSATTEPVVTAAPAAPVSEKSSFLVASSQMTRAERLALQRSLRDTMANAASMEPTQENRIAFRNAVAANERAAALNPAATAEPPSAPAEVASSTEDELSPVVPPKTSAALPSSGAALNLLVIIALVTALLHVHPDLRRRLTSTLLGRVQ
jgi:hypothetical protein